MSSNRQLSLIDRRNRAESLGQWAYAERIEAQLEEYDQEGNFVVVRREFDPVTRKHEVVARESFPNKGAAEEHASQVRYAGGRAEVEEN